MDVLTQEEYKDYKKKLKDAGYHAASIESTVWLPKIPDYLPSNFPIVEPENFTLPNISLDHAHMNGFNPVSKTMKMRRFSDA